MRTAAYLLAVQRVADATADARPLPVGRLAGGSTGDRPATRSRCYDRAVLDHEEKFLFKEEILTLSNSLGEPGALDNVEDLLTDVITSPRFDSEVFTLERSLQVMLGGRAGHDARRAADRRARGLRRGRRGPHPAGGPRAPRRVARPLRAGDRQRAELPQQPRRHPGPQLRDPDRARRGAPRPPGPPDARPLQQRAAVLRRRRRASSSGLVADVMDRLGPYLESEAVDAETVTPAPRRRRADRAQDDRAHLARHARSRDAPALPRRHRPEPRQDHGRARAARWLPPARAATPGS